MNFILENKKGGVIPIFIISENKKICFSVKSILVRQEHKCIESKYD